MLSRWVGNEAIGIEPVSKLMRTVLVVISLRKLIEEDVNLCSAFAVALEGEAVMNVSVVTDLNRNPRLK